MCTGHPPFDFNLKRIQKRYHLPIFPTPFLSDISMRLSLPLKYLCESKTVVYENRRVTENFRRIEIMGINV